MQQKDVKMKPTINLSTKSPKARELEKFPSAGPRANITGMRKLYWGKDAYIVKCGQYIYKVDKETYERI